MTPPSYALPLRLRKAAEAFVVQDAGGVALAYVYFEEDPGRRRLVNRLSDAKSVATTIAKALTARSSRPKSLVVADQATRVLMRHWKSLARRGEAAYLAPCRQPLPPSRIFALKASKARAFGA